MTEENLYTILYEVLKLVLQFGGALFIAWKAVGWALGRYKREKHWERKLQAFSEVLSALGTMNQILTQWIRDEERRSPEPSLAMTMRSGTRPRHRNSKKRRLWPRLFSLPKWIAYSRNFYSIDRAGSNADRTWLTALEEEQSILSAARDQLLLLGKRDLSLHSEA